jgi:hypothetical protein
MKMEKRPIYTASGEVIYGETPEDGIVAKVYGDPDLAQVFAAAANAEFQRPTLVPCECCEDGQVWIECCNGSEGCPCQGKQVLFGQCKVCGGIGQREEHADTKANLRSITSAARLTGESHDD